MSNRIVLPGFSNSTKTFTETPYFKHLVSKGSSTNRKRARLRHTAAAQQILKIFKRCSKAELQHSLTNRPPKHSSSTSFFRLLQCMGRIHQVVSPLIYSWLKYAQENKLGDPDFICQDDKWWKCIYLNLLCYHPHLPGNFFQALRTNLLLPTSMFQL